MEIWFVWYFCAIRTGRGGRCGRVQVFERFIICAFGAGDVALHGAEQGGRSGGEGVDKVRVVFGVIEIADDVGDDGGFEAAGAG